MSNPKVELTDEQKSSIARFKATETPPSPEELAALRNWRIIPKKARPQKNPAAEGSLSTTHRSSPVSTTATMAMCCSTSARLGTTLPILLIRILLVRDTEGLTQHLVRPGLSMTPQVRSSSTQGFRCCRCLIFLMPRIRGSIEPGMRICLKGTKSPMSIPCHLGSTAKKPQWATM